MCRSDPRNGTQINVIITLVVFTTCLCNFYVCYFYEQLSITGDIPLFCKNCQLFGHNTYTTLDESLKPRLLKCIESGIENPDSTVGCYTCQPDDYDIFKQDIFRKGVTKLSQR